MPCHSEGYILLCSLALCSLIPIVFYFCSSPSLYRNCSVWAKSESWGLCNKFSQGALPSPGSRCFSLGLPSQGDIQQLSLDSRLKTEDTQPNTSWEVLHVILFTTDLRYGCDDYRESRRKSLGKRLFLALLWKSSLKRSTLFLLG